MPSVLIEGIRMQTAAGTDTHSLSTLLRRALGVEFAGADIQIDLVDVGRVAGRPFGPQFGSLDKVPHLGVKAPSFLPDWLFAYPYPHNVISEGVRIPGCDGQSYCSQLPIPVFPTPFYETIVCLILFFALWYFRKRLTIPGTLFALYLILNGVERFFVEKIRVNSKYDIFGFRPTQAELISAGLVLSGAAIWVSLSRRKGQKPPVGTAPENATAG